jgi:tyrosinase
MFGFNYTPDIVAQVSSETVYDRFNNQLENGPHAAVHQGVAGGFRGLGDLGPASSPNGQSIQLASLVGPHWHEWSADPIFFLHHTNVDRIWWQWQQQDPQTRTFAYGGSIGENGPTADLDDILPMQGLAPDSAVREYMDVNSAHLCYTY